MTEPQSPLLKILCAKGLSIDESMELVQYCLQELGKHTHPSPETLERLEKLEKIIIPVVAFISKQMENEEWWAGFNQRASNLFTRGKFWGTVIITFLATIATINGWWLWILQASLHALADKN